MRKQREIANAWPFDVDQINLYAYWDNLFDEKECNQIIKLGKSKLERAGISKKNLINKSIRDSKIAWIFPHDENAWIFRKITMAVTDLNKRFFGFDLWGAIEGLQFTSYQAPGQHYHKHVDRTFEGMIRKVSLTIELSDPKTYKGGDLVLYEGDEGTTPPKARGKLIAFPSFIVHEVKPVTKGTRYSLVCWVTGPNFK